MDRCTDRQINSTRDWIEIQNRRKKREREDNGLFIKLVPKVSNNVFSFVDLTTLGT